MVMNVNNSNNLSHSSNDDDRSFQRFDLDGIDFKIVLSGNKTGGGNARLQKPTIFLLQASLFPFQTSLAFLYNGLLVLNDALNDNHHSSIFYCRKY